MVSLQKNANLNSGGATFFDVSMSAEDNSDLQPILDSYGTFRPLRTVPLFLFHTAAALALEVAAVVVAALRPGEAYKCREYFYLIYAHAGLWLLTLIVDLVARKRHYALRINGYLELYKKTQVHHRLPLYVVSLWNSAILVLQALMQYYYPENFAEKCVESELLSPVNYFCALMTLEFCTLFGINLNYILIVRGFNKQRPLPDVQKENWNACSAENSFATGEVGCRESGQNMYDFIEKQADMIRHLKDHNARLGEKLMVLNAQLQARTERR